jgi:hypothetical protein
MVGVQIRSVSTSVLDEGNWLASRSVRCVQEKKCGTHLCGSWVDSRVRLGVSGEKKLSSDWDSNFGPSSP